MCSKSGERARWSTRHRMISTITPRLIELTYEAALRSFWRRNALRKFLKASHLTESFLATWNSEESKRDYLDRVFQALQTSEKGKALLLEMAEHLSEQRTFPDL